MSYIDIIILVIIAIGAIRGFSKGLIVEIATLLALVLGVFITMRYSVYTEKILKDFFNASSPYTPYVALGVTFIVVVIGIYILGKLLTNWWTSFRSAWSINCWARFSGQPRRA